MQDITIEDILRFEEGYSEKPYIDTEGYPTIGIGTRIGPKGASLSNYTFTVGRAAAGELLMQELNTAVHFVDSKLGSSQNTARRVVLVSMAYQLGVSGLSKFRRMWSAIEDKDWDEAADEALDSVWARQTPERAKRHAEVLRSGTLDVYAGLTSDFYEEI